MIEKDSKWILPENLKKQEKKSWKLIDEGKDIPDWAICSATFNDEDLRLFL